MYSLNKAEGNGCSTVAPGTQVLVNIDQVRGLAGLLHIYHPTTVGYMEYSLKSLTQYSIGATSAVPYLSPYRSGTRIAGG